METMTALHPPAHAQQQTYPTESQQQQKATRTDMNMPHPDDRQHQPTNASQESVASLQSATSSVMPRLHTSDSNLSQLTAYADTDNTSPSSDSGKPSLHPPHIPSNRDRTPENNSSSQHTPHFNGEHAFASPMSITSPATVNGAKRTASGHVKNAPSLPNTPYTAGFPGRASRRDSISSSGSRAGELAATLKARLGYAMAKVQNGWEHKSFEEVQQLAANRARNNRHSMSHVDQHRPGTSGLSNGAAKLSMYDQYNRPQPDIAAPPPSKRHSGSYYAAYNPSQPHHPSYSSAPRLQPAPDIRPTSSRSYAPQALSQPTYYSSAMSPPRTPNVHPRRPPTIRTETQTKDAEMDALQALIGLGSPHTSQVPRSATANSSQASPQKMNLDTPRRVTFARSESDSSARPSSSGGSVPARIQNGGENIEVR